MNIPNLVKGLGLPDGSFIVVGSGIMHVMGIRHAGDIDLVVSGEAFDTLLKRGWKQGTFDTGDTYVIQDIFEASMWLPGTSHKLNVEQLLNHSVIVDDIPFTSLQYVLEWKRHHKRDKDIHDIRLIEAHIAEL